MYSIYVYDSIETELRTFFETEAGLRFTISYLFDENDKLTEVVWQSVTLSLKQSEDDITNKYGQPLGYSDGQCYVIVGDAFIRALNNIEFFNSSDELYSNYTQYTEWDYQYQKEKHVKIEMVQYYVDTYENTGKPIYYFYIGYKFFTSEVINNIKKVEEKEKEKIINDI